MRQCSRNACAQGASATLTYVHADATVVLGPLASKAGPGAYDLCAAHAERFSPPRNWHLIRLQGQNPEPQRSHDDLLAIADAVREAAAPPRVVEPDPTAGRRLRVVREQDGS